MRIELTQDINHLLTKGNHYEATRHLGGGVEIRGHFEMVIPAEFYRNIEVRLADGTVLEEHKVYEVTYQHDYGRQKGSTKTLHGWEYLYGNEGTSHSPARVTFLKRGSHWGGKRQSLEVASIVSAQEVEAPAEG